MAALLDQSPAYNREILSALTPEEVRAELEKPDVDLSRKLPVDETPITLGDLQTILDIEDYAAYLCKTYFSGHQWTREQLANLESLNEQLTSSGIRMAAPAPDVPSLVGPSGIDHGARVNVEYDKATQHFNFKLINGQPGKRVTFDVSVVSGSQVIYCSRGNGEMWLAPDDEWEELSTEYAEVEFRERDPDGPYGVRSDKGLTFYLRDMGQRPVLERRKCGSGFRRSV